MTLGVDYPWTHPSPAALQAAGVQFAMRYLSNDPTKNLSRDEADALAAVGIWVGVVWETTAGRALDGQAAGADDARAAAAQAAACGMPATRPIYFAVDMDTDWASAQEYFTGVASVLGSARTGVYGGLRVVQGAAGSGLVSWFWQASAWSNGQWDPRAHVRQLLAGTTIGGVDCDQDTAMTADFGQWMPGVIPATSQPAQGSPAILQGDDVAIGTIPAGFAFDVNGNPTDRSKAVLLPLPTLADGRWPYTMIDLSFGADFVYAADRPVKLRVAVHNTGSGWRIEWLLLKATDDRVHVWLQAGDDKVSVGRVPLDAADTGSDVPAGWLVECR